MQGIKWLGLATALLASGSHAAMVDFDLTNPGSSVGRSGAYATAYNYQVDGLSLTVRGLSSGGDRYNPFSGQKTAKVGLWSGGLGVEKGGLDHAVDNALFDYDTLVLEFNSDVVLETFSLGYIGGDSDVSFAIGSAAGGSWVWTGDFENAKLGKNSAPNGGLASTTWYVGAFNPLWGSLAIDDLRFDSFKLDGVSVSEVSAVPLPAGAWLLLSGVAGFVGWRRKVARRSNP